MDTDLQAKEAPCLPAIKSFCLWLQGLLSESHVHLLGRCLSKGGRPNPMLRQNMLHKEEVQNRGKKQFLNPVSTKHKHLSQKSPQCWDTPEDSLLKQFPWLPEECTQWRAMTSAPWEDLTVGLHLHSLLAGCHIWSLLCTQTKANCFMWMKLRLGGKLWSTLMIKNGSGQRERDTPGDSHPLLCLGRPKVP